MKMFCIKQNTYVWPNCDISRLFLVLFYLCDVWSRSVYLSDLWCLVKPRSESGPHSRPVPPLSAHAAGNGSTWWCTLSVRSKQTNHTFKMIWFYREEQLYISQLNLGDFSNCRGGWGCVWIDFPCCFSAIYWWRLLFFSFLFGDREKDRKKEEVKYTLSVAWHVLSISPCWIVCLIREINYILLHRSAFCDIHHSRNNLQINIKSFHSNLRDVEKTELCLTMGSQIYLFFDFCLECGPN